MSLRLLVISLALSVLAACSSEQEHAAQQPLVTTDSRYTPEPYIKLEHPEWSRKAAMYQINTRQFTPEGTFKAAQEQLPRLQAMGIDILWLMPIHPIGEKNRKGTLGSPYLSLIHI